MVDFIFVVDSPYLWHKQNIVMNRHHYSGLATLGPTAIVTVAERVGVGVYFNTLVDIGGRTVKYGTVGLDAVRQDLLEWTHLYVAGRLQKPVLHLCTDAGVMEGIGRNLHHAVAAALLLLPREFDAAALYRTITALSYMGDVRMGLAEDGKKVDRIVSGSFQRFSELYREVWGHGKGVVRSRHAGSGMYVQDLSSSARLGLLSQLPASLLRHMAHRGQVPGGEAMDPRANAVLLERLHATGQTVPLLRATLASIVGRSSRRQAIAGLLSAGVAKSAQYVFNKVGKLLRS